MKDFQYDGEMTEQTAQQFPPQLSVTVAAPEKRKSIPKIDLTRALGFTTSDLAANQQGQMTPGQAERLSRHARTQGTGPAIMVVLSGLFWVWWWNLVDDMGVYPPPWNTMMNLFVWGLYITPIPFVLMHVLSSRRRIHRDVEAGMVERLSGRTTIRSGQLDVAGSRLKLFKLRRETFAYFIRPEDYTVYYAPRSKVVLSAEPVEP